MRWIIVFFFLMLGCLSNTKAARTPSGRSNKVSNVSSAPPLEVFVLVDFAPRRPQEIELGVVNSGIKGCLVSFISEGKPAASVIVEGKIDHRGELQLLDFEGSEPSLVDCVKRSAATVKLGRGKVGPFKLSIATGPELIKGAKGMVIGQPTSRKFE